MSEPAPVMPPAEPQTPPSRGPWDAWSFGAPVAEPGGPRRHPIDVEAAGLGTQPIQAEMNRLRKLERLED